MKSKLVAIKYWVKFDIGKQLNPRLTFRPIWDPSLGCACLIGSGFTPGLERSNFRLKCQRTVHVTTESRWLLCFITRVNIYLSVHIWVFRMSVFRIATDQSLFGIRTFWADWLDFLIRSQISEHKCTWFKFMLIILKKEKSWVLSYTASHYQTLFRSACYWWQCGSILLRIPISTSFIDYKLPY